jgi:hypothetical protein
VLALAVRPRARGGDGAEATRVGARGPRLPAAEQRALTASVSVPARTIPARLMSSWASEPRNDGQSA